MTATAQNKIGGLSLIIGTSLVVAMLSLTPGLGLIDYVDADDFIGMGRAIQDHLALTFFAAMLGVLGLVLQLYGVLVLRRVVPSGNERRRRRHHRQIWRHGPRLGSCSPSSTGQRCTRLPTLWNTASAQAPDPISPNSLTLFP